MLLTELTLRRFRNHTELTTRFLPGVNLVCGPNGCGKTNLLDAIHYLSVCRSYFMATDVPLMQQGSDFFFLEGNYTDAVDFSIDCSLKAGQRKTFRYNGHPYETLAAHLGLIPLVMITPPDGSLIADGSEVRRRFMDMAIAQCNREYVQALGGYKRCLVQRNALLKTTGTPSRQAMKPWEMQLIVFGQLIHRIRQHFCQELVSHVEHFYALISGQGETVNLNYESQMNTKPLAELIEEGRRTDEVTGRSNYGPHKDDLHLLMGGESVKLYASQGQQKTFVFAMKLALHRWLWQQSGKPPLLLLDDLYEKLDGSRLHNLLSLVSQPGFSQVFVTDTDTARAQKQLSSLGVQAAQFTIA